jgi:hypothetical protein
MNESNDAFSKDPAHIFPMHLQPFEAAIQADQRVLGMLYTGSLGRGTSDRFSDLDIEVWVTDAAYAEVGTIVREILSSLGAMQFLYSREAGDSAYSTAFFGTEWQPIDLAVHRQPIERDLPPASQVRIIKDTTHHLERMLIEASAQTVEITFEQARMKIEDAIDSYIYLNRANARGDGWYALGKVTACAGELYTLLAALRGFRAYAYRYTAQVLSPEEKALLAQVWPAEPLQQEVKRAARALWAWTRSVWQQAERLLGRSLLIQVDEAALLSAVDRLYAE